MITPRFAVVFVAVMAAAGCSSPNTKATASSSVIGENVFELDAFGRRFVSAVPAQVHAAMGSPPVIDFWFQVGDQVGAIAVTARLAASDVGATSLNLELSGGALTEGRASVEVKNVSEAANLDDGTLQLNVSGQSTNGQVTPGASGPWSFKGKLVVSCWVPGSLLPNAPPSGGTAGDGALVKDEEFVSAPCGPLRAWAGK